MLSLTISDGFQVETAVLSITAKAKAREMQKQKSTVISSAVEKMDVDTPSDAPAADVPAAAEPIEAEKMETGEKSADADKSKTEEAKGDKKPDSAASEKKKEPEAAFEMLDNPARVMPQQRKVF